jgi:hypothetical protein
MKANRPALQEILKRFLHMGNIIYSPTEIKDEVQTVETFVLKRLGQITPDMAEYQNLLSRFFKQVIRQQREMVSVGNRAQKLFQP